MSSAPKDWTKTGTIAGYAEYLRKSSGALAVIVIRRDDSAMAVDAALPAADVQTLFDGHLPGLIADLTRARVEKRKAARLQLPPLSDLFKEE